MRVISVSVIDDSLKFVQRTLQSKQTGSRRIKMLKVTHFTGFDLLRILLSDSSMSGTSCLILKLQVNDPLVKHYLCFH